MKVLLLYTGSIGFPLGDAYTNRVLCFAKGLISVGCDVNILIIYPGRGSGVITKSGIYEDVPYRYLAQQIAPKNKFYNKLIGILGIINLLSYTIRYLKKNDVILSFTESFWQNVPVSLISRLKKIIFLREVNEFPREILKKGLNGLNLIDRLIIKHSSYFFNGLICISNGLKEYFVNEQLFKKPVLIVPILVDNKRFNAKPKDSYNSITYCGNLFGEKDGVDILIKSFANISPSYPEYKLILIGDLNNAEKISKLKILIDHLKIEEKVELTGIVKREEIPILLSRADILVLARPNNLQSQGGFPTKLGEYLATGKPVLTTKVGDIPIYLSDGIDAYLAEPGDVDSFSSKLLLILSDYSKALEVGKNGKHLADEVFNPDFQAKRIVEFVLNIKKSLG